jgi:type II protein arginine methyltransferase
MCIRDRDARPYYYRGQLYRQKNELIRAIADYRQAVVLQPDWMLPYSPLCELLFSAGSYSEVIPYLETLEKAGAGSPTLDYQLGVAYHNTNQIEKAIAHLRQAQELPDAQAQLKQIYRQKVSDWHFPMMNDPIRNEAFNQALLAQITPDMTVLDIGAGSGLLSMQAARAGAKQVICCEMEPTIADIAQQIIARNGYADKITLLRRDSRTLQYPADLPHKCDLLVTETFGSWLVSEGCLETIVHARQHLLKPNAIIIPASAVMYLALVEVPQLHQRFWVHQATGFDLSLFNDISPFEESIYVGQIDGFHPRFLSAPFALPQIDFYTCPDRLVEQTIAIPATQDGTVHGICAWFDLHLTAGITITNHYDRALPHNATCWGQWVKLFPNPTPLRQGQQIAIQVTHQGCELL